MSVSPSALEWRDGWTADVPNPISDGTGTSTHASAHFESTSGARIYVQRWLVEDPTSCIVLLHGIHSHTAYTFFSMDYRYTGSVVADFAAARANVYALDYQSHGCSTSCTRYKGKRALFRVSDVVDDVVRFVRMVATPALPTFLVGSSFGGMVAIRSSVVLQDDDRVPLRGMVLLCPLVAPDPDAVPNCMVVKALQCVAFAAPAKQVVALPPNPMLHKRYMDDPLCYTEGKDGVAYLRAGVAIELKRGLEVTEAQLPHVRTPFLLIQGADDTLSAPVGATALMNKSTSTDKTLLSLLGMHHNMLLEPGHAVTHARVVGWIQARVADPTLGSATAPVSVKETVETASAATTAAADGGAVGAGAGAGGGATTPTAAAAASPGRMDMAVVSKLLMKARRIRNKSAMARLVGGALD